MALGFVAAGIVLFSAWAIYAVAPTGGRTVAQLQTPDGRAFIIRHYRFGWLEYPKVRFYVRDTKGVWTSIGVFAELVNPNAASLVLDEKKQQIDLPGAGTYYIQNNYFVHVDGDGGFKIRQLPPGVEPGEEDIN